MISRRYFASTTVALVVTVLATLFLAACQQTQQQATPIPAPVTAPPTEKVFVMFEGPWAFAPDPANSANVVAIAPKTKSHRDLFVKASHHTTLAAGTFELSIPPHTGPAAATADPSIFQADIEAPSLQHALDSKSVRYVIRLPKPEEYVVASRSKSRLDAKYPPDASTEKEYASGVSLRYDVSNLNGFSLTGVLDDNTPFNPLPLKVETPVIRFVIHPAQQDNPMDKCDTHSREGFRDLTKLLGLTLYVDFPDYTDDCHHKDPQKPAPAKASALSLIERVVAAFTEDLFDAQAANLDGERSIGDYFAVAMYLFNMPAYDCASPHIILKPKPPKP